MNKGDYVELYSSKLRKANQVLVYAKTPNPINAIKNIDKKARDFLEETGVNVAYMAFGFVRWKESDRSEIINKAPLLLVPIKLKNESAVTPYFIDLTEDDITDKILETYRPSICNRLDRNTSGLVICAKSLLGARTMNLMLKDRTLDKYYRTIVSGRITDTRHFLTWQQERVKRFWRRRLQRSLMFRLRSPMPRR